MINHTVMLVSVLCVCTSVMAMVCARVFRQPENQNPHKNRSLQLDGLRGVLACCVVAHHFYYNFHWREGGSWGANSLFIINLGAISVSLFFLMSAYLHIGKIRHSAEINWWDFYVSRAKRIYPLYLAVFLCVLLILLPQKPINADNFGEFLQFVWKWLLFQNVGFQGSAAHLIIAGVQWTLVYEWAVYAIMPLIHMIYHRKLTFQPAAWAAMALAWWIIQYHSQKDYYWLFILALPAVVLAKWLQAAVKQFPKIIQIIMWFLTAYLFIKTVPYSWEQRILLSVWFAVVAQGFHFHHLLNYRGLVKLGDLSYAIYLTHGMVIFVCFGVLPIFEFKQGNFVGYLAYFPLILSLAVFLSYLSNRYVENYFVRKK